MNGSLRKKIYNIKFWHKELEKYEERRDTKISDYTQLEAFVQRWESGFS